MKVYGIIELGDTMIKRQDFMFPSEQDGLPLGVTLMIPDQKIKGIVQICHGMCEHRKRYLDFMYFLVKQGYVVIAHDHRGHGESVRSRKDLGYFYDESATFLVEDVYQISCYIKDKFKDRKLILFGHSMGSLIVRNYLARHANAIDGLIVCGSPSRNSFVNMGILLVRVMKCFLSDHYRSRFLNHLALGSNRRYQKEHDSYAWLTRDERVRKIHREDKDCQFIFTLEGFQNLFLLLKRTYQKDYYLRENLEIPILFLSGSDDKVMKSEKKWHQAQEFLKSLGYQNISSHLYAGMRHEILNEIGHEKVYQDVLTFCNENSH